jgi:diguanylate cyclase (GGDEF)-like protein
MSKEYGLVRFHTWLSAFMLCTILLAGSLAGLFLIGSVRHHAFREDRTLTTDLTIRARHLDTLLSRYADRLHALRATAEDRLRAADRDTARDPHPLLSLMTYDAGQGLYHLDALHHPASRKEYGSLTGSAFTDLRDTAQLREMGMALDLVPHFRIASESFSLKPALYYLSARKFLSYYPWQPAGSLHFTDDLLKHPLYIDAGTEQNPRGDLYWASTPLHDDNTGLMASCAAPVYENQNFLGILAMDFHLHDVHALLVSPEPLRGTLMVVDGKGQILASSPPLVGQTPEPPVLAQILPEELRPSIDRIMEGTPGRLNDVGNHTVLRIPLGEAPWQLLFFRQNPGWYRTVLHHLGPGPLFSVAGLVFLTLTWMLATHFYIIGPSGKLLTFILALGRRHPANKTAVPLCWQPWFNTVEDIFRQNQNLTEQIAHQNKMLEKRIAKRTRDLGRTNAALRKANRKLQALSMIDELTRLANYRHFEGFLQQVWGMMQRRQEPVSLLLCDVDYFKQYNDTYGHEAGNRCLQAIAGVLSELAHRSCDLAARYGGEEFIVLLPGLSEENARIFAGRIQASIAGLAIPHTSSPAAPTVTLSIGIGTMVPSHQSLPRELFDMADKALYRAKSKGRNCIA